MFMASIVWFTLRNFGWRVQSLPQGNYEMQENEEDEEEVLWRSPWLAGSMVSSISLLLCLNYFSMLQCISPLQHLRTGDTTQSCRVCCRFDTFILSPIAIHIITRVLQYPYHPLLLRFSNLLWSVENKSVIRSRVS